MPINPVIATRPRGVCGVLGHLHPMDTLCQVLIAAADGAPSQKRIADYVLTDGETLNAALRSIGFDQGKIHLSDGHFPDDAA